MKAIKPLLDTIFRFIENVFTDVYIGCDTTFHLCPKSNIKENLHIIGEIFVAFLKYYEFSLVFSKYNLYFCKCFHHEFLLYGNFLKGYASITGK